MFKKSMVLGCVAALALSCSGQNSGNEAQQGKYQTVEVNQAKEILADDEVVLLDVRTDDEYHSAHLPGARQLNFNSPDFENQLEELPKEQTYMVYCHSGNRSRKAMNKMKEMGFEKVYNMDGGISAWQDAGGEIE